jgi:hypothetical protein
MIGTLLKFERFLFYLFCLLHIGYSMREPLIRKRFGSFAFCHLLGFQLLARPDVQTVPFVHGGS